MTINGIIAEARLNANQKGFWDQDHGFHTDLTKIALMHTELAEATEAVRDGNYDGPEHSVVEELADAIIRIADFCGHRNLDLDAAIEAKLKFNRTRPHGHERAVVV